MLTVERVLVPGAAVPGEHAASDLGMREGIDV